MINRKLFLLFTLLMISVALLGGSAKALSGSEFQAGRIMDDPVFFNSAGLDPNNIQAFLNSKVPVCDTNGTQPYGGTTRAAYGASRGYPAPYICLKDYRQDTPAKGAEAGLCNQYNGGNKSAAQIIYDVSQACNINPKVLIVLLQKEQSLISDDWPWSVQYRSATGYGCPDTAPCDAEYYGFFNQVYHAARQFKRYARDESTYNYRAYRDNYIQYNPNAACGGTNVYIQNQATAGLYNYTPYQPNPSALANLYGTGDNCGAYGNRNFWRMFRDWFGLTSGTVLLRASGDTVYVLSSESSTAYGVPSGEALKAYGLHNTPITQVSDAYISSLNTSQALTTLFMKPNDNTIYLADAGNTYGISSGEYCTKWNLPCGSSNQISKLPSAVTDLMPVRSPLGNLMQFNNYLFYMDAGNKRSFLDSAEKSLSPWANDHVTVIHSPLNSGQPSSLPILYGNRFFSVARTGAIYYHAGGQYYSFNSFDNFKNWWNGSLVLSDIFSSFNSSPPAATLLPNFSTDGTSKTMVAGNRRFSLPAGSTNVNAINTNSHPGLSSLINAKENIVVDDSKAFGLPGGAIVTLRSGQLRPIPSMTDLWLSFTSNNIFSAPSSILDAYPIGKLYVIPGRVVKPSDAGGAMYVYGDDGYLWAFGTVNEMISVDRWRSGVITAPFAHIEHQGIKVYTTTIKMNGSYYAVQPNSHVRQLPTSILSANKDAVSLPLSGNILWRIAIDSQPVGFIRFDNGTIFKVEASSIRPIGSLSTYFALGGNATNTIQMSVKSHDGFNIGSPL